MPRNCPASVFVVVHIGPHHSELPAILAYSAQARVVFGEDGALVRSGHVYVAPPDRHMLLANGRIHLSSGPKVHYTRPAADPLFKSAAETYGPRVLGIVLSGGDSDGAEGLRVVKLRGGRAIVQDPEEAVVPSMPYAAIMRDHPDACLPVAEITRIVRACFDGVDAATPGA